MLARAHHGSVTKEQRALIEDDLKSGRLPTVVATSSLELGIDMGAVDLVVQVESPPSVSSGLQRVGRAGHQVGAVSRGVMFPKFRADLVTMAVITERMRSGQIEALRVPSNPLDVLAQHVVAMTALDDWDVDELHALVRRAAPFGTLSRPVLESVLDMLSGRYPSEEFAELRPRVVWDRIAGTLSGRPGAQRLAVTSGGTIPDRGLYGVFLATGTGAGGGQHQAGRPPGRRARRGDGLRVAGRRRVHPRRLHLADRGHHPRPGARHPRARASPEGCRSGTATRSAARSSSAAPSASSSASSTPCRTSRRAPGWPPAGSTRGRPTT